LLDDSLIEICQNRNGKNVRKSAFFLFKNAKFIVQVAKPAENMMKRGKIVEKYFRMK